MPALISDPALPSTWTSSIHPKVEETTAQVDGWFLQHWPFPNEKARKKFVAAGFSRVTCLYFPRAHDERIASACKLLTILFLIDDLLEEMSFDEGKAYNEHLMPIAEGKVAPDWSIPVEWMFHAIWDEMRKIDMELANSVLEPVFVFMRAQTDKSRVSIDQLGSYLVYRERDVGSALLSALMRFSMNLELDPKDLAAMRALEENHAKHIAIVNDIYSWEKELKQAEQCAQEGSALCSAVKVMADNTGLDIKSSKKVLWSLVREWEMKHEMLCTALYDSKDLLDPQVLYAEGLKYQMSGNETWSKTTPRKKKARKNMVNNINSYPLGALDDIMPDIDLPFVLTLPCRTHSETAEILSSSFRSLLSSNPWMRCTVNSNAVTSGHRLGTKFLSSPLDANGNGSSIHDPADLQLSIQDISQHPLYENKDYDTLVSEHMPSKYLSAKLLIPSRETSEEGMKFLLKAKVSFIKNGVFLCLCTSHAVMDASGLSQIAEAWALQARGETTANLHHWPISQKEIGLQGGINQDRKVYDQLKGRKELWHMLGLDYRPKEMTSAMLAKNIPQQETVTKIFGMSAEQQLFLKELCRRPAGKDVNPIDEKISQSNGNWISNNDATSALIWRCIVRARLRKAEDLTKTSTMMYAMNIRGLIPYVHSDSGAKKSKERIANVIVYSVNEVQARHLVTNQSMRDTANDIRAAVRSHREPAILWDVLRLAASIPDVSCLGLVYPTWLAEDVVISSLSGLRLYKTHWGSVFGEDRTVPDYVRFPEGIFEGITFVMPEKENGDVEVVVTMIKEDMEMLLQDTEWQEYMKLLC
ncbi:uncharacterized protein yc1106_02198 [Curvularia clavata]|uniref:Uncharacterized protein n=1 Tax=Curvularia clavata TaxID=95742 RepID=A0A9Q8Z2S6_CURCL|nr:uncharacterized protein yc1106_02198 [Curvularia clavata]